MRPTDPNVKEEASERLLEHIHKIKFGEGKSLRMLQRGFFSSHKIILWICF
jgi:hypothetical protein